MQTEVARKDIVETVAGAESFRSLSRALRSARLVGSLRAPGPFTLFAPTDEAFAKVGESLLDDWLRAENRTWLKAILNYHVASGRMLAAEIVKSSTLRSVQGTGLTIRCKDNRMHVNNARVLRLDVECGNGVIHVIDTVLIPR